MLRRSLGLLVGSLALVALTACSFPVAARSQAQLESPATADAASVAAQGTSVLAAFQETLQGIYENVNPSVVNIRVGQSNQGQGGQGSGFVWDKAGHIVTNNHVIAGAGAISVTFADGTVATATLVGADPDSDLAVLKVNVPAGQLKPLPLADSTKVKVGQVAVAIGNPFGLEGTMTAGIVSAIGRALPAESVNGPTYSIPNVIQTDASINPGNSGGALVNDLGQLVGVTSAIISPSGTSAGIGFAIPSSIVSKVVPDLITSGAYEHPYLGISGTSLTPDIAQSLGIDTSRRGAVVLSVTSGSPAAQAGLRGSTNGQSATGSDVIVAVDGKAVRGFDELSAYLFEQTRVGQTVKLAILRGGSEQTVSVTLVARRGDSSTQPRPVTRTAAGWLGVNVADMTSGIATEMSLPTTQTGVLVQQVVTESPAEKAGIRGGTRTATVNGQQVSVGGDVITSIDGQAVTNVTGLRSVLAAKHAGDTVTVSVLRNGSATSLTITLGERPIG